MVRKVPVKRHKRKLESGKTTTVDRHKRTLKNNKFSKVILRKDHIRNWESETKKVKTKEEARQLAIDFQNWSSEQNLSLGELINFQNDLGLMGRKFGLIREFRENGII